MGHRVFSSRWSFTKTWNECAPTTTRINGLGIGIYIRQRIFRNIPIPPGNQYLARLNGFSFAATTLPNYKCSLYKWPGALKRVVKWKNDFKKSSRPWKKMRQGGKFLKKSFKINILVTLFAIYGPPPKQLYVCLCLHSIRVRWMRCKLLHENSIRIRKIPIFHFSIPRTNEWSPGITKIPSTTPLNWPSLHPMSQMIAWLNWSDWWTTLA